MSIRDEWGRDFSLHAVSQMHSTVVEISMESMLRCFIVLFVLQEERRYLLHNDYRTATDIGYQKSFLVLFKL